MKPVNAQSVRERIEHLELQAQIGGRLPIRHEFEMACLRELSALQQKLDAMAAENAAIKSVIADYAKVKQDFDDFDGDRRGIAESLCEAEDALVSGIKTPATDACLNSVRAEGAQMCIDALVKSDDDDFTDAPNICAAVMHALRSGTHYTAVKAG